MSEQNTNKKLTTFLDTVGRMYLGVEVTESSNDEVLAVQNPVILHISDENGRMSVRLIPVVFREFLADKSQDSVVMYKKALINTTNVEEYDFRLQSQYDQMFNKNNAFIPPQPPPPKEQEQPKVVNLFDE